MSPNHCLFWFLVILSQLSTGEPQTLMTQDYGGSGGGSFSYYNRGRINSISEWGICGAIDNTDCSVTTDSEVCSVYIRNWASDAQTSNSELGYGHLDFATTCSSVWLDSDDYIVGYTVYYDNFIHGLEFHTLKSFTYSCRDVQVSQAKTTVYYYVNNDDFYYLTGWGGRKGAVLDSIHFQFTKFAPTAPPTTEYPSLSPTTVPTQLPTLSPTACRVVDGKFCGYTLFVKGYNIFNMKTSGNALLDIDYIQQNTESWTDEGSTCSYSSLEFHSQLTTYSQYASADTDSIALRFMVPKFGAGGVYSTERTKIKQSAMSQQTYIYFIELECKTAVASVVASNNIFWNANFVNHLRTLPRSYHNSDNNTIYSNDILTQYTDFWDSFGTHLIKSAEFGGNIRGAITADKCSVDESYSDSTSYTACLNAAYKGFGAEACTGESHSTLDGNTAWYAITNKQIIVKGGDNSEFTDIFNTFGNKENDFQDWINQLGSSPDIIGGDLHEIHDAIQLTVNLGNHKLNDALPTGIYVDDDTWLSIANALKTAYQEYSKQLIDADTEFTECTVNCDEGTLDRENCVCTLCDDVAGCCGIEEHDHGDTDSMTLFKYILFLQLFSLLL